MLLLLEDCHDTYVGAHFPHNMWNKFVKHVKPLVPTFALATFAEFRSQHICVDGGDSRKHQAVALRAL